MDGCTPLRILNIYDRLGCYKWSNRSCEISNKKLSWIGIEE